MVPRFGLKPCRIDDNEIVVFGDGFSEGEAERATVEEGDTPGVGMVLFQVSHHVNADPCR